jgi:murein DD-endopeptidase MepM/ murein hydrolase activator NlpD
MKRVKVEKTARLPAGRFCENLVRSNNLAARGFSGWAFHPGMLFNTLEKWWGDGGQRTSPHEGIDICLYYDGSGALHRLDTNTEVPVIFEGRVKRIIEDYLGSTLFVAHDICDNRGNQCYTIYGHVNPAPGIASGTAVSEGKIIAAIADTERKKAHIIPHLHISIAWVPENFPADQLAWESMHPRHTIIPVNPLDVLRCSYSIVEQKI